MKDVGVFHGHLVYYTGVRYLWTFGAFCGNLVHFTKQIWQPCTREDQPYLDKFLSDHTIC
jgi:hypothetical protein